MAMQGQDLCSIADLVCSRTQTHINLISFVTTASLSSLYCLNEKAEQVTDALLD